MEGFRKYYWAIITIILCVHCNQYDSFESIESLDIFNNNELVQLEEMVEKFDRIICLIQNESSPNCLNSYLEEFNKDFELGFIESHIDETQLATLFNVINDSLKSEIFYTYSIPKTHFVPGTTPPLALVDSLNLYQLNLTGKYKRVFNEYLAIHYKHLERIKAKIENKESLSSHEYRSIFTEYEKYDLNDKVVRLHLAFELMCMANHSIEMKRSYDKVIEPIEQEFKKRNKEQDFLNKH